MRDAAGKAFQARKAYLPA
ncbi:MAG: hypothetical protein ACP5HD_05255 [Thermoproteus sp.]